MSLNPFSHGRKQQRPSSKRKGAHRLQVEQLESRLTPSSTPYSSLVLADSPLAYWRLDEGQGELTGQNLGSLGAAANGLYIGAPAFAAAGAMGGNPSVAFNKPDDSNFDGMQVTNFAMPTTALSIEFWVKTAPGSTNPGTPLGYAVSGSVNEFIIFNDTNLRIIMNDAAFVDTGISVSDGNWHHIVLTWESATGALKVYDNASATPFSATIEAGAPLTSGGTLILAQEQDSVGGTFQDTQEHKGELDEVAIYNTVLTLSQVQARYAARTSATNNAPTISNFTVDTTPIAGGLLGTYYNNPNFTSPRVSRVEAVNFNWAGAQPDPLVQADTFSVRWEGLVEPQFSQNYTFFVRHDDGARLWINNELVIDEFYATAAVEHFSRPIALTAGQKYSIRLDFFENGGNAVAELSWQSSSQPKQIIPANRLFVDATHPGVEGSAILVRGTISDADTADQNAVTISWGDGTSTTFRTSGPNPSTVTLTTVSPGVREFTAVHYYADDPAGPGDVYAIAARVSDDYASATAALNHTMTNTAPNPTIVGSGGPAGTTIFLDTSTSDPDAATYSWTVTREGQPVAANAVHSGGSILTLDGVNDFVEVPDSPTLHSDRQLTVSGWFKADAFPREWQNIFWKGNTPDATTGGENREYGLWLHQSGSLTFSSTPADRVGVGELALASPSLIQAGRWYHFAAVVDADANFMGIYIDGTLVASRTYNSAGIRDTNGPLRLGGNPTWNSSLDGALDDIQIWNVARTPGQIMADMTRTITPSAEPNLVAYYRFAPTESRVVVDSSTAGNDGRRGGDPPAPAWISSPSGSALAFDGINDYVVTPNLRNSFSSETVTLEVWFKAEEAGVIVTELGQSAINTGWHDSQIEILASGQVRARVWNLGTVTLGTASFNTWNHAVLRYDKATLTLDGFLNGTPSTNSVNGDRLAPWENGAALHYALAANDGTNLGSGAFFKGQIDEFRVWNTARTTFPAIGSLSGTESGLVLSYQMNEGTGAKLLDQTANNYDASFGTAPEWTTSTVPNAPSGPRSFGSALKLDGVDDFVDVPNSSLLHSDRQLTFSGWVKVDSFNQTWQNIFWKGELPDCTTGCGNREYGLWLNSSGYLHLAATPADQADSAQIVLLTAPGVISTGQWYHVAAVINTDADLSGNTSGSYMAIYVNGVRVANQAFSKTSIRTSTGPLRFGANPSGPREHLPGSIDEFALWNRALSQSEIESLRDRTTPLTGSEANLIAHWSFDEGSGTTVADSTSNNLDGLLGIDTSAWPSYATGAPTSANFSFTPADDGTYVVTVTATDDEGTQSVVARNINVFNLAPVVNLGNDITIDEGQTITRTGTIIDLGANSHGGTVNYGEGAPQALTINPNGTFALSHTYNQQGTYTVSVNLTDDGGALATNRSAILADAPIAYYRLGEPTGQFVADLSGNANHGTLVGTAQQGATGAIAGDPDTSYTFTRQGHIDLALPQINLAAGQYNTVEFWMKWDGSNSVMPFGFTSYDLWFASGSFGFNTGAGDIWGISSTGLAGNWVHVTAQFHNGDASQSRLWINGVEQTITRRLGTTSNARSALQQATIAAHNNHNNYRFGGGLDEFAIYNRALTQTEITRHYTAGQARFQVTVQNVAPTAVNNSYTVSEDGTLSIAASGILANDTDPGADTLSVTNVTANGAAVTLGTPTTLASGATLTVNANGSFTYVPAADFNGSDSFNYQAHDGTALSNIATVTIDVLHVNDAPIAVPRSASATEDTVLHIPVSALLNPGGGSVLAQSTFDTGDDGWRVGDFFSTTASPTAPTHVSSGGNPGGFVRTSDIYSWNAYYAPASFLGDKSAAYGGSLQLDIRASSFDTPGVNYPTAVMSDGTLVLQYRNTRPSAAWSTFNIPFVAGAGWEVKTLDGYTQEAAATAAQIQQVLANLAYLRFNADWNTGSDQVDLDNVKIVAAGTAASPGPANESHQTLRVLSVAATANTHGTVSLNDNGTPTNFADDYVVYTPDSNFHTHYTGPASFTYAIQDNGTTSIPLTSSLIFNGDFEAAAILGAGQSAVPVGGLKLINPTSTANISGVAGWTGLSPSDHGLARRQSNFGLPSSGQSAFINNWNRMMSQTVASPSTQAGDTVFASIDFGTLGSPSDNGRAGRFYLVAGGVNPGNPDQFASGAIILDEISVANPTWAGFTPDVVVANNQYVRLNLSYTFAAGDPALGMPLTIAFRTVTSSVGPTYWDNATLDIGRPDVKTATSTVSVAVAPVNDAPALTVPGPQQILKTQPLSFAISASDIDFALDANHHLSYAFTSPSTVSTPTLTQQGEFGALFEWTPDEDDGPGPFTFDLTVTDNGSPGLAPLHHTLSVTVTTLAAALVGNDLVVVGTSGNDNVLIDATNLGAIQVTVNGAGAGTFNLPAGGKIIANLHDGDDTLRVLGGTSSDQWNGGQGTDRLEAVGDFSYSLIGNTLTGLGADALSSIEEVRLEAGGSDSTFEVSGYVGAVEIDAGNGNDSFTFRGSAGVDAVSLDGFSLAADNVTVALAGLENISIQGEGGADIITAANTTWSGSLAITAIGAGVELSAVDAAGVNVNSGSVLVSGALAAASGGAALGAEAIDLQAAVATTAGGAVTLSATSTLNLAAAGDLTADGVVSLSAAAISTAGDISTTDDAVTFTGPVTLTGDVTISAGLGDVTFNASVVGKYILAVNSAGVTTFNGDVGSIADPLQQLITDAPGTTVLGGNVYTGGDATFKDAVILKSDVTITDGPQGTGVFFEKTVDSDTPDMWGLKVVRQNPGSKIIFQDEVGGQKSLKAIETTGPENDALGGETKFEGGLIRTKGAQKYFDTVNLFNETSFDQDEGELKFGGRILGKPIEIVTGDGANEIDFSQAEVAVKLEISGADVIQGGKTENTFVFKEDVATGGVAEIIAGPAGSKNEFQFAIGDEGAGDKVQQIKLVDQGGENIIKLDQAKSGVTLNLGKAGEQQINEKGDKIELVGSTFSVVDSAFKDFFITPIPTLTPGDSRPVRRVAIDSSSGGDTFFGTLATDIKAKSDNLFVGLVNRDDLEKALADLTLDPESGVTDRVKSFILAAFDEAVLAGFDPSVLPTLEDTLLNSFDAAKATELRSSVNFEGDGNIAVVGVLNTVNFTGSNNVLIGLGDANAKSLITAGIANFDDNLAAGFDDALAAGFDDAIQAGFDDLLAAGFQGQLSTRFDGVLSAGFEQVLAAGFADVLLAEFDDAVVAGFEDALAQGFEDALAAGFEDALQSAFDDALASGFQSVLAGGFEDQLAEGFEDAMQAAFDDALQSAFDDAIQSGFTTEEQARLQLNFEDMLAAGFDEALAAGFDDILAQGFQDALAAGFEDILAQAFAPVVASGFNTVVRAGFDDALQSGFDDLLAAGFDDSLQAAFADALAAGFEDALAAGFDDVLFAGFDDALVSAFETDLAAGFADELMAGFEDSLLAGFDDALQQAFDDALAQGFETLVAGGFEDALAAGFQDALAEGFEDALAAGFDDALQEAFATALAGPSGRAFTDAQRAQLQANFNSLAADTDFEDALAAGFDDVLAQAFQDALAAGFDDILAAAFDATLSAGFDDILVSGFEDMLAAGFEDDLAAGFEDELAAGYGSVLSATRFDDALQASFADILEEGFRSALGTHFSDELMAGFEESLAAGFEDALLAGFDDALQQAFDDALASGFDDALAGGFADALAEGFEDALQAGFKVAIVQSFEDALAEAFADNSDLASFEDELRAAFDDMLAGGFEGGVAVNFFDALAEGFSDVLAEGFADVLAEGFDDILTAGFDDALAVGFDDMLQSGFDDLLASGFEDELQAGFAATGAIKTGFEDVLAAGFQSTLRAGFDDALVQGFEDALAAGFEDALLAGFDDALQQGFDDALAGGFEDALAGGFEDSLAEGFSANLIARFDDALQSAFDDALVEAFEDALAAGYTMTQAQQFRDDLAVRFAGIRPTFEAALAQGFDDVLLEGFADVMAEGFEDTLLAGFNTQLVAPFVQGVLSAFRLDITIRGDNNILRGGILTSLTFLGDNNLFVGSISESMKETVGSVLTSYSAGSAETSAKLLSSVGATITFLGENNAVEAGLLTTVNLAGGNDLFVERVSQTELDLLESALAAASTDAEKDSLVDLFRVRAFMGEGNDTVIGGLFGAFDGGSGSDRFYIHDPAALGAVSLSPALNPYFASFQGGTGSDTYYLVGAAPGNIGIVEEANLDSDTIDLSSYRGGSAALDLALTSIQQVGAGLAMQFSDAAGVENIIGTAWADQLSGNERDNLILGGDLKKDDRVSAAAAPAWHQPDQVVYLDFNGVSTVPGATRHVYTPEQQAAIKAIMEEVYAGFSYQFYILNSAGQPMNDGGVVVPVVEHMTVFFNQSPTDSGSPRPGGHSDEVDLRNVRRDAEVEVDINGFLGGSGQPEFTEDNIIKMSAIIAAHEVFHAVGGVHSDAHGPIGFGIHLPPGPAAYLPPYPGPAQAFETTLHIIASPASVGSTLFDLLEEPFFGERELIKLALNESWTDGVNVIAEGADTAVNVGLVPQAQTIGELVALNVPNLLKEGLNVGKAFDVAAMVVTGEIGASAEFAVDPVTDEVQTFMKSESDFYAFRGRAGDLINMQALSVGMTRLGENTIDPVLRVYGPDGQLMRYYGTTPTISDDDFDGGIANIVDLILPEYAAFADADGNYTFYVEVDSFTFQDNPSFSQAQIESFYNNPAQREARFDGLFDTDTGDYELFIYRFSAYHATDGNDTLVGRGGNDVFAGGTGNDSQTGGAGNDTYLFDTDAALGNDTLNESGGGVDHLDFSATKDVGVKLELHKSGEQTINANLRLTLGAYNTFEDVTATRKSDDIHGNSAANVIRVFAGDNKVITHGGSDIVEAGAGDNDIYTDGGSDTITITGNGDNKVRAGRGHNTITVTGHGEQDIDADGGNDIIKVTGNGEKEISAGQGNNNIWIKGDGCVEIDANGGHDVIYVEGNGEKEIEAGQGNNTITICGNGEVEIDSNGGNDVIIVSGNGEKEIDAGGGNNDIRLHGDGEVEVETDGGNDVIIVCGNGEKEIDAGGGNNTITISGNGCVEIDTDGGDDVIKVNGNGEKEIDVGGGKNTIEVTGDGDVEIEAGAGDDDDDDDDCVGDNTITVTAAGDVEIDTGGGKDVIVVTILGACHEAEISTGQGDDRITVTNNGETEIDSDGGNDFILIHGAGCSEVDAGSGNDTVRGGDGNDEIIGGSGDDVLIGGAGNDLILGDSGNDVLVGGFGADTLQGGSGHDVLIAGALMGVFDYAQGVDHSSLSQFDCQTWADNYELLRALGAAWAAGKAADDIAADGALSEDIWDESTGDRLTGSSGKDWFIVQTQANGDTITDKKSEDKVTYTS